MSIDLNKIIKAARNADLIITPSLNEWLLQHGDEEVPEDVAAKVMKQMTTKPRVRSASFSASSAGMCERRQVLGFLGIAEVGATDPQLQNIFNDGKWRHLRWQTMLLTAGLMDTMESPLRWKRMRSLGTMDGRGVVDDSHPKPGWRGLEFGLELKGVSGFMFPKYRKSEEFKAEHKKQVHRYFLMSGLDLFVIIYEDKSTNNWFEWVIEPDDETLQEQLEELRRLNNAVDQERLPPILPQCKARTGPTFNECPYGGKGGPCLSAGTWPRLT